MVLLRKSNPQSHNLQTAPALSVIHKTVNIEESNKIEHCMMFLTSFARSYYTFFAIYEHLDTLENGTGNLFPFRSICNAILGDAAISWCKVFGAKSENTHWKKVINDHNEFKSFLYSELETTHEEFTEYWREMTNFRSKVIAHFEFNHFNTGETPSFEIALRSCVIAHKYFKNKLSNLSYTLAPECLEKYGKEAAKAVVRKLHV